MCVSPVQDSIAEFTCIRCCSV